MLSSWKYNNRMAFDIVVTEGFTLFRVDEMYAMDKRAEVIRVYRPLYV